MIREHTVVMPRSTFLMILGLLLLLVVAASTVYGVLPQYKEWKKVDASLQLLIGATSLPVNLSTQIEQIDEELKALKKKLSGDSASLPEKQFESHIIGQLQEAAWQHGVQLEGITPTQGELVERFRETLFDVTLSGGYEEIYFLLGTLKEKLGFVVVKRFTLDPGSDTESKHLEVHMVLASYRMERA